MEGLKLRTSFSLAATVAISIGGLALTHPLPVKAATVAVSASQVHFGSQEENTTSSSKTVHLTNTDVTPLTFTGIFVKEGDASDFVITRNGCGQSLAPGASCSVEVVFRPGSGTFGPRSSTLEIDDDASLSPQSVTLIGEVASPDVQVDPSDLSFGPQAPGTVSGIRTVSVHNDGNGSMRITDLKLDPTDDFDVVSGDCFTTLDPGHSCSIEIRFSPKTASGDVKAIRTSILTITDNDPNSPTQLVSLDGSVPTPQAQLSTTIMDFGDQAAGTSSAPKAVTLQNTGSGPLTLAALEMKGLDPDDFNVKSNACPGALPVGGSCQITIAFAPQKSDGALSALMTITDDAPTVTQTVALRGNAKPSATTTPPVRTVPPPGLVVPIQPVPAVAAPASATPSSVPTSDPTAGATPDTATPLSVVERPVAGRHHAPSAAPRADEHNLLVSAILTAVGDDGAVLRGLLTGVLTVLPFAILAAAGWAARLVWMRRRRSDRVRGEAPKS
jgi:hypothetical protein